MNTLTCVHRSAYKQLSITRNEGMTSYFICRNECVRILLEVLFEIKQVNVEIHSIFSGCFKMRCIPKEQNDKAVAGARTYHRPILIDIHLKTPRN